MTAKADGQTGAERRAEGGWHHPNDWDLYTPITSEIRLLFQSLHDTNGSWRTVAAITETRLRVLRRIRTGERKTISMTLLDRMLTLLDVGVSIEDFTWYTPQELVSAGIWEDVTYIADQDLPKLPPGEIRKRREARARKRKRWEKKKREMWIEPQ